MRSSDSLDLERDLPTSKEDVVALRRFKKIRSGNWLETLQQLFDALPPQAREPRRVTDEGRDEFEL